MSDIFLTDQKINYQMIPINLQYDPKFLEEEVREGHLVTSDMKKLWLVELDILNKFIQICEKYNLSYFADAGTLLGAVRHNGFVPWDDDVDVIMPRDDYEKFLSIVKDEIQYPYCIEMRQLTGYFTKIKRLDTIKTNKENLNKKYITRPCICIDIFSMDSCPNMKIERNVLYNRLLLQGNLNIREFNMMKNLYGVHHNLDELLRYMDIIKLGYETYEKWSMFYNDKNTKYVFNSTHPKYQLRDDCMRYKEDYSESIMLPFEMIELRCPKGYERCLDIMYTKRTGVSWHTFDKYSSMHNQTQELFIDIDNPYTKYMQPYFNIPDNVNITPKLI